MMAYFKQLLLYLITTATLLIISLVIDNHMNKQMMQI